MMAMKGRMRRAKEPHMSGEGQFPLSCINHGPAAGGDEGGKTSYSLYHRVAVAVG